jgi:dipeptidyl-peptidase-4
MIAAPLPQVLLADPSTGATRLLHEDSDACWLEWLPGLPAFAFDGDLLVYRDHMPSDTRRVCKISMAAGAAAAENFVTPAGVQVLSILSHSASGIIFSAILDSPCVSVHHAAWNGQCRALLGSDDGGHHIGLAASHADPDAAVIVLASSTLASCDTNFRVIVKNHDCGRIANNQISPALASPPVVPDPVLLKLTSASLATVLLFPKSHVRASCRLPLVMCPYGGPHHAKAIANGRSHALAQCAPPCHPQPRVLLTHCAGTSLTSASSSPSPTGVARRGAARYGTAACTTTSQRRRLRIRLLL